MVSNAITDYVIGKYGRSPVPIDDSIKKIVLKDAETKFNTVTSRPANQLKPEMGKAKEELSDITSNIDDVLIYALYPTTGLSFLRGKYGLEVASKDLIDSTTTTEKSTIEQSSDKTPVAKTGNLKAFNVYLDNEVFYVEVDPANLKDASIETHTEQSGISTGTNLKENEIVIRAPINGIVIKHLVNEGDQVTTGQDIVVLEAMKMENTLPSPASGIVKEITHEVGIKVDKGTVLVIIEPNN